MDGCLWIVFGSIWFCRSRMVCDYLLAMHRMTSLLKLTKTAVSTSKSILDQPFIRKEQWTVSLCRYHFMFFSIPQQQHNHSIATESFIFVDYSHWCIIIWHVAILSSSLFIIVVNQWINKSIVPILDILERLHHHSLLNDSASSRVKRTSKDCNT